LPHRGHIGILAAGVGQSSVAFFGSEGLVSDIFHEVDEEVRREQFKKLWDRWGNYILALMVVVVLAVAAWRAWEWWQAKKAMEAGAAFEAALTLAEADKHQEAEAAFAKIAADAPSGYRILARFREAAELGLRDKAAAIKLYDALAADGSIPVTLRELASIRAGFMLVDTAPYDEMRSRLEPFAEASRPFRHTARELIALAAWRMGDMANARKWFDAMNADAETPTGARARIEMLMALAAGEGKT
jgi:hypothetical protein